MRLLNANEIDLRVKQVISKGKGASALLLAYKDARCDMNILDEIYTPLGWQRKHEIIGDCLYCTVSVWDKETNQWVSKQDVGTESMTEREKGQASDSFKRACFNLGIGRELYTAPAIWINLKPNEIRQRGNSVTTYARFYVKEVEYDEKRSISYILVVDDEGNNRFEWGTSKRRAKLAQLAKTIRETGKSAQTIKNLSLKLFNKEDSRQLSSAELDALIERVKNEVEM